MQSNTLSALGGRSSRVGITPTQCFGPRRGTGRAVRFLFFTLQKNPGNHARRVIRDINACDCGYKHEGDGE